jgi:hypothetical protein
MRELEPRAPTSRRLCASLSLCLLALAAGSAARVSARDLVSSPHTAESHLIYGAKGLLVGEFEAGESRLAEGGGLFIETTVFHDLLELELGVVLTTPGDTPAFAFEPLLKLPLHAGSFADPYLGAGAVVFHDREHGTRAGVQAAVGTYFWLTHRWGIDVDMTLAVVPGREVIYELATGAGPVVRF